MTKHFNLRSKDNAREALTHLVREHPDKCNSINTPSENVVRYLLLLCGQPAVRSGYEKQSFFQYWEELPAEHRHRIAIPVDVAHWIGRVQGVFNGPMDFDHPSRGRVEWKEGLRRCKSQLLL